MLQIFRVAGIPVRVDASWLLVFGLISWSLASGYFPYVLPDVTRGAAGNGPITGRGSGPPM